MVTTNNEELARRLRIFRNHGINSDARQREAQQEWFYEMVALGYNYRLTDIACALGLSQLRRLDHNLARRREIAMRYTTAFEKMPGVIPPAVRRNVSPAWHLYPIRLDMARMRASRNEVFRALRAEKLGVNVHYIPVYLHPYYREQLGYRSTKCPVAEDAYGRLISLPMFHGMTDKDIEYVIETVGKVLKHNVY